MQRFLLFVFLLLSFFVQAQQDWLLDVTAHNDFFNYKGHITDKYYTGGHRIGVSFRNLKKPDRFQSFALQQKIYTPSDISQTAIDAGDYPYNGLLYFSYRQGRLYHQGKTSITAQLDAGTTGTSSGAGVTQTAFHKLIKDKLPRGWNQALELGGLIQLQLDFRRLVYQQKGKAVTMFKSFQVGTIYNRLQFGMEIKAGSDLFPFLRQHGAFFTGNQRKTGFYFFASPLLTYVHRNRMFDTRQLVKQQTETAPITGLQTEELVTALNTGFVFYSPSFQLTLSQNMNSPEFSGASSHTYGEIGLQFRL